jgi:hypothetical protein
LCSPMCSLGEGLRGLEGLISLSGVSPGHRAWKARSTRENMGERHHSRYAGVYLWYRPTLAY